MNDGAKILKLFITLSEISTFITIFNLGVYKVKDIRNRFRNLFCRACFRCNDETSTC